MLCACTAFLGIFALSMNSCHSSKKTIKTERVVILDDQEVPLTKWINCSSCAGKGSCVRCNGTGKVSGQKCISCRGTGNCSACNGEGGYRAR